MATPVGPIIRTVMCSTSSRNLSSSGSRRQRLLSAMATARLASCWPTMKRSSSETISRGEKSVMTSTLPSGSAARLPGAHGVERMHQHQDVQRQVVANDGAYDQLHGHGETGHCRYRE